MWFQGIINAEGELEDDANSKTAWKAEAKEFSYASSLKEKTKKNVMLELSLFLVVCTCFVSFNIWYWTQPRAVFL